MSSWDVNLSRAKALENSLEQKIHSYSSLAQQINANFVCDEESPLVESSEEQQLFSRIEEELAELYDCIQSMRQLSSSSNQEQWIKRYYEIHFDFSTEFKKTSTTVQRKRDSLELMRGSKNSGNRDEGSGSMARMLLEEKLSIAASMRSINEIISQAWETKNSLESQRGSLVNSSSGLGSIASSVPGIGWLIDGIQKKKHRENIIIAAFIAILICFTIWYILLR